MTPNYDFVLDRFTAGLCMGLVLFLLRNAIDQRKGLLAEAAAVSLPILVASVGIAMSGMTQDMWSYGSAVAVFVQFVFLTLPILVAARLIERLRTGETPQIADLFRITTVVSLATFVYTSLPAQTNGLHVATAGITFLLAERASTSRRPGRAMSLAFTAGFLLAILMAIALGDSMLSLLNLFGWFPISLRSPTGSMALLAMLGAIVLVPISLDWWWQRLAWFHLFAWKLAALRFAVADPPDQIFSRSPFRLWRFRQGTCFLNHGSFGAVPNLVRHQQASIRRQCEEQPMDFLVRHLENQWLDARFHLATWLGTQENNLAFCENATSGMNELAAWFPLAAGDEVLLNDHEYGAVRRIWQRACERAGASCQSVTLPQPFTDPSALCDAILDACTERTRLVILSHITSPTAVRLPVEEICPALRSRNIATCIDGPHALLQEPIRLASLDCDFYTGSCHKWLCAPLGSGFLYIHPRWHAQVEPCRLSWGRVLPAVPEQWSDELLWTGTRDYSAYLSVPSAIRFFQKFDRERLDVRNHELACYARRKLSSLPGCQPVTPEGRQWFGWMVGVWLPPGDHSQLQQNLFTRYGIEVPIIHFSDRYLIRVSCHLYNHTYDIDFLVRVLARELDRQP